MNLQYFVGKVCTIGTVQVNFSNFKIEQMMDYFVGVIEEMDNDWLIITHHITKCKSCIAMKHIVVIAEGQVLSEDNPEYEKLINEYKKPEIVAKPTPNKV